MFVRLMIIKEESNHSRTHLLLTIIGKKLSGLRMKTK